MSNWSKSDNVSNNYTSLLENIVDNLCLYENKIQAAGTNDKKWWKINIERLTECRECIEYFTWACIGLKFGCSSKRHNKGIGARKPEYTPEQQEMIDWLDAYPYAALGFSMHPSIVRAAYKEIINKHRSK